MTDFIIPTMEELKNRNKNPIKMESGFAWMYYGLNFGEPPIHGIHHTKNFKNVMSQVGSRGQVNPMAVKILNSHFLSIEVKNGGETKKIEPGQREKFVVANLKSLAIIVPNLNHEIYLRYKNRVIGIENDSTNMINKIDGEINTFSIGQPADVPQSQPNPVQNWLPAGAVPAVGRNPLPPSQGTMRKVKATVPNTPQPTQGIQRQPKATRAVPNSSVEHIRNADGNVIAERNLVTGEIIFFNSFF